MKRVKAMHDHISDKVLQAFMEGTLGQSTATDVAIHLDQCSKCATRSTAMEPLRHAFASLPDPLVPENLHAQIIERLNREPSRPSVEIWLGLSMLAAACILIAFTFNPWSILSGSVSTVVTTHAAVVQTAHLFSGYTSLLGALSLTTILGSVVIVAIHKTDLRVS
jgi:anti-sigma factor RsiW